MYFQWIRRFLRWFVPGIGVKRWVLLAFGGMTVLGMGLALLLYELYVVEYTNDNICGSSLRLSPAISTWLGAYSDHRRVGN